MDLTSASPSEFFAKMKALFGDETFNLGYCVLHQNKIKLIKGTEDEIFELLKDVKFADNKARDDFIKFAGTYIIVHGLKY